MAWIDQLIPSMLLYLGLPILMHCYREFVIFYQHCVRQRFDGRAPRRAPAHPAASSAALSCPSSSVGPSCLAPAPAGMAASQTCAYATPQPHAACVPRGGREEGDVDRAAGRRETCVRMGLSPTAAAAAIARPRSSSSRFVSTTCAAGKHRAEAHGESRHTTEDLFEVREGCRFD